MHPIPFIGREEELRYLKRLFDRKTASLVVIKGWRRIGKSRLVEENESRANNNIGLLIAPGETRTPDPLVRSQV